MSETDIISKFILPAVKDAGWDDLTQIRQEVKLRDGKIVVRGKLASRIKVKSADIVLYHKPNLPLAVIEAKANKHAISKGMQQGLDYAGLLDVPFVFASNGDGFIFHDKTNPQQLESEITLDAFPAPELLWQKYCDWKGFTQQQLPVISQDYYDDGSGKSPRYYQMRAINRTIDAVSAGKNRILLVMATGTGKTYTAFQIIWRLWKARNKKRILFLADRNILVDQTKNNDFQPFGTAMTKVTGRTIDPAYEVHLALYQAITGPEENQKAYKQVAPDFFDLIVIDECHRGSASEDSAWREILEYFGSATQIGLTATPKETEDVSNIDYFGEPVYTYSLKEGIEDGFLAPYKVVRVDIDVDVQGWRPVKGQLDKYGKEIKDRIYNLKDFDRTLIVVIFLNAKFYPTLIAIPLLMALIAMTLILTGHRVWVVGLLLGFWGLLATAAPTGWWTWIACTLPDDAESGGGLMVAVIQFSIALGSTVGGMVFDHLGWQSTFALSGLLLIAASALTFFTSRQEASAV
ncbi:EcoAI/FtnUII family type I restriction enzme subunit R [Morganella morganii]